MRENNNKKKNKTKNISQLDLISICKDTHVYASRIRIHIHILEII